MSLKKTALGSVLWTTLESFGNGLLQFFISLILARLLLPEDFGNIAILSVFIGVTARLVDSGLAESLIRTPNINDEDLSTVFFFNVATSLLLYLLLFFSSYYIGIFFNSVTISLLVKIIGLTILIDSTSSVHRTILKKDLEFKKLTIISLPSLLISGLVGIGLAYLDQGVWSLVWSKLSYSVVSSLQLWYRSAWKPAIIFKKRIFMQHFRFGYKLALSGIIDVIYENAVTILLGRFYKVHQVGLYGKANSLQMMPVRIITNVIGKVSYPLLSTIQDDDNRLKHHYSVILQLLFFVISPLMVFMAVMAEPLFRFLYTEKWLLAVPYFQLLCFVGITYPLHVFNMQVIKVKGRSEMFLKLEIIKKMFYTLILVASFNFGITGLLIGTVIHTWLMLLLNMHYGGKLIQITIAKQLGDMLPVLISTSITGIVVHYTDLIIVGVVTSDFIRLLISLCFGSFIYICLSYFQRISSLRILFSLLQR